MNNIKIAIDGFSSCGKSTLAKQLASKLGFLYIDTGAMYRAITLYALRNNIMYRDGTPDVEMLREHIKNIKVSFQRMPNGNMHTLLNGEDVEKNIRTVSVSRHVSAISKIDFVRAEMVDLQRNLAKDFSVVMDGRDIGTVVFPDAQLKIFVTASPEVRAQRRYDELIAKGEKAEFDTILSEMKERDYRDMHRDISPLVRVADAYYVDSSYMTIEDVKDTIVKGFKEAIA